MHDLVPVAGLHGWLRSTATAEGSPGCARLPLGRRAGPGAKAGRKRQALRALPAFRHSLQYGCLQSLRNRGRSLVAGLRFQPKSQFPVAGAIGRANHEGRPFGHVRRHGKFQRRAALGIGAHLGARDAALFMFQASLNIGAADSASWNSFRTIRFQESHFPRQTSSSDS